MSAEALPRVLIFDRSKSRLAAWHVACDDHNIVVSGLRSKRQAMQAALAHAEDEHQRKARIQYSS